MILGPPNILGPIDGASPVVVEHPLNRGKRAWWLATPGLASGRTFVDLVGRSHGTFVAAPAWKVSSRRGAAVGLLLDGTSDYVNCGTGSASNPTVATGSSASGITLGVWIKGTDGAAWLLCRDDNALGRSYALGLTSGQPTGQINGGGGATATSFNAADGVWHHLCLTGSPAAGYVIYVDGISKGTGAWSNPAATTGPTTLGRRTYTGFEEPFGGELDDAVVYERGLSAAEVRSLYDLSLAGYPGMLRRVRTSRFAGAAPPLIRYLLGSSAGTIALQTGGA